MDIKKRDFLLAGAGAMAFESNDEPPAITGREHSKRKMPI